MQRAGCPFHPEIIERSSRSLLQGLMIDTDHGAAIAVLFGGVEREGQSPETIRMAVAIALGGEEHVAALARLLAHAPEVRANQGIRWDAQSAALEDRPERISDLLF